MIIDLMRAMVLMPQLRHRALELCGGSHILARYEQTFAQYLKGKPDANDEVKKKAPAPETCDHWDTVKGATSIKRYGNPSGRYARCRRCLFRWKWNDQAKPPCWAAYPDTQDASRASSSQLPLPTSVHLDQAPTSQRNSPASSKTVFVAPQPKTRQRQTEVLPMWEAGEFPVPVTDEDLDDGMEHSREEDTDSEVNYHWD